MIQGTTAQHWITSPDSAHSNNLSEAAAAACTPLHFRGVVLGSWRHQTWPVLAAAQRSFWGSSAVGEGNWKSHMEEELEPVDNQNNNVMVYVWFFPPFFLLGGWFTSTCQMHAAIQTPIKDSSSLGEEIRQNVWDFFITSSHPMPCILNTMLFLEAISPHDIQLLSELWDPPHCYSTPYKIWVPCHILRG